MALQGTPGVIRSFGRCAKGRSVVYMPTDVAGVQEVFALVKSLGSRVVIRGGGHSFDGQALHEHDNGTHVVLSTSDYEPLRVEFDDAAGTVTLGAGVTWGHFLAESIRHSKLTHGPIRVPGSMQTGRKATAGGTLAGDCLSRFSGLAGKESAWIQSFRIVTPSGQHLNVAVDTNRELFDAVVGGHGYIGFVTDVTYRLVAIDSGSCARTVITRHLSFRDLIEKQLEIVNNPPTQPSPPVAVSAAWFTDTILDLPPRAIKGAVFTSTYALPSDPPLPGFPLYSGIDCPERYWTEVIARIDALNLAIHEILFVVAGEDGGVFENDLMNFLFFMDGNTVAKETFEATHKPQQFPIVQQTFVVPVEHAEAFAETCETRMRSQGVRPAECDMLFVRADDCLMSANHRMDGFAVTLGFEPIAPEGCPPESIVNLLIALSRECAGIRGRIHLVKNVHADKSVLRQMFMPQIKQFEDIKKQYDPDLIIPNPFSDRLFDFT
jgi:decaprenylphospho-beta-D-ribofuranose 2-oxidase